MKEWKDRRSLEHDGSTIDELTGDPMVKGRGHRGGGGVQERGLRNVGVGEKVGLHMVEEDEDKNKVRQGRAEGWTGRTESRSSYGGGARRQEGVAGEEREVDVPS